MNLLFQWLKTWCFILKIVFTMAKQNPAFYHENSSMTFFPPTSLENSSYFGFSSAYNMFNNTLLVSAPTANRIGKLLECNITSNACNDVTPQHILKDLYTDVSVMERENFNHLFWLGATVRSGPDMMMVCAPRYTTKSANLTLYSMKGRCYYSLIQDEWIPMYDVNSTIFYGSFEDSMHTLGWSVDVTKTKTLIGGPGMGLYRTGLAAVFNNKDEATANPVSFIDVKPPLNSKQLLQLEEYKKYKNFGYSVTIGNFVNKNQKLYVVSSTYGNHGAGMVFLFEAKSSTQYKLHMKIEFNEQGSIGSMFGAELCSIKNKEKLSILLVGAPAFGTSSKYNTGAVYFYKYSSMQRKMNDILSIEGKSSGGYFGRSMVSLGDADGDQYEDVAIAAPYENDGEGSVYIYSGADLANSRTEPLQILKPSSSSKNFGLSLSTLKDYDKNGCNELAVGAPSNDTTVNSSVTVYKCYAFVTIKVYGFIKIDDDITISSLQRSSGRLITLVAAVGLKNPRLTSSEIVITESADSENIQTITSSPGIYFDTFGVGKTINDYLHILQRKNLTHFEFTPCLNVTYPEEIKLISAKVKVAVHLKHKDARFVDETNHTILKTNVDYQLELDDVKRGSYCNPLIVKLPLNGDYNQQLQFDVEASLVDSPMEKNEFKPENALLSSLSSLTYTETVSAANCTRKEKCEPELSLEVKYSWPTDKKYLADTSKVEHFYLELSNSGEVAYAACIVGSVRGADIRDLPTGCERDPRLSTRFKCTPSKYIATDDTWTSKAINLDFSSLNSDVKSIDTIFWVYDYSCPTDLETVANNSSSSSLTTLLFYDYKGIKLNGKCNEGVDINVTVSEIDSVGKRITHFYDIKNDGVTDFVHLRGIVKIKKDPNYALGPLRVMTDSGNSIDCKPSDSSDKFYNTTVLFANCSLENLRHTKNIRVTVPIDIKAGITEIIKENNLTITTEFTLVFPEEEYNMHDNVTSKIFIVKGLVVPVWVIVLAVILGLLLLILIVFLMVECGCLRRKKHEELQDLKKEIRRQSVRRSMMLRDSVRSSVRVRSGETVTKDGHEVLVDNDRLAEIDEAQEAASQEVVNDLYISADIAHEAQVHPHPKSKQATLETKKTSDNSVHTKKN